MFLLIKSLMGLITLMRVKSKTPLALSKEVPHEIQVCGTGATKRSKI
jgi:hypothetical protein